MFILLLSSDNPVPSLPRTAENRKAQDHMAVITQERKTIIRRLGGQWGEQDLNMQLDGPCSSFVPSTTYGLALALLAALPPAPPSPVRPVSQIGLHPSLLFPFVFSLLVSVLQHHPCCIRKRHAAQPGAAASPPPSVFQSSAGRIARLVKSDASHHTQVHNSDLPVPSNSYHAMPSGKCAFYLVSETSS
ncbi:hypothetical protein CCUS01_07855 [Colletotrichum cuscutae]|uniref:Uncharacterized protein n=1 Tax=Colletotrichum cuscutae TaxID=1209917 RepID=A0AAI9XVJ8_9PEZI|nr:hypothetical protein CCUS01_07855 [Colletotrichum cuscutae]